MTDADCIKLLGSYCSYTMGQCVFPEGSAECRKRNPVECRNCRQRNERDATAPQRP